MKKIIKKIKHIIRYFGYLKIKRFEKTLMKENTKRIKDAIYICIEKVDTESPEEVKKYIYKIDDIDITFITDKNIYIKILKNEVKLDITDKDLVYLLTRYEFLEMLRRHKKIFCNMHTLGY